jgi:pSer/pThr/pTyr-binding forkhead associated (FHA) protein
MRPGCGDVRSTYLEVWQPEGRRLVPLESERMTIGKTASNDLTLEADPAVSRVHALVERLGTNWCVRDLASRNGTFVNGERVLGERALHTGDEIRLGATRLVFRGTGEVGREPATRPLASAPELTRRERDVLLALCRPVLSGDVFTQPASIRHIAEALVVTEAAVKQHLTHLYDKFGIEEDGESRRVRLANEAVQRGAVSLADLEV